MTGLRDGVLARAAVPVLLALGGCASVPDDASTLAVRVDAIVAPRVAANEFAGAIVMTRRGEVVYRRAFGMANREAGLPFAPDIPSDGGSLAKTFTAAGIALLVAEGRVDLEAPVARYVPAYPHAGTTVRRLLDHSNGLPPYYEFFDPYFAAGEVRTTDALLAVVAKHAPTPSFPPGSRFEYSNLGFDTAALVIERASGLSYADFVRVRFFEPLGMRDAFARPARFADWPRTRAIGYRWRDGAWTLNDAYDLEAFLGASNLVFSADDLGRWGTALAAGRALPPAVWTAGQRRSTIDGRPAPITMLSWYCDDAGTRCHYTGSHNGFHALVAFDRARDESVAFVSNSSLPPWATITLQRDLVDALAGRPARAEPAPAFRRVPRAERSQLAGRYAVDGVGTIAVTEAGGRLRMRIDDGLEFDAFGVGDGVYYVPGTDGWFGVLPGDPPALHYRTMYVDGRGRRLPRRRRGVVARRGRPAARP